MKMAKTVSAFSANLKSDINAGRAIMSPGGLSTNRDASLDIDVKTGNFFYLPPPPYVPVEQFVFFTQSGTWTAPSQITGRITYYIVGGGGGGGGAEGTEGRRGGDGGSAGQVRISVYEVRAGKTYSVIVGTGGTGGIGTDGNGSPGTASSTTGGPGGDSSFDLANGGPRALGGAGGGAGINTTGSPGTGTASTLIDNGNTITYGEGGPGGTILPSRGTNGAPNTGNGGRGGYAIEVATQAPIYSTNNNGGNGGSGFVYIRFSA
jgi:hypothetical protein